MTDAEGGIAGSWLARVLGLPPDALAGVTVEPVAAEAAFCGRLARVTASHGLPGPVVVKRPAADPEIYRMMAGMGFYTREHRFYADLAAEAGVDTPRLLGVDDADGEAPVLVLEACAAGLPGDQFSGIDAHDAVAIARAMAGFHARLREDGPAAARTAWVPGFDDGPDMTAFYDACWPDFARRFGHCLPDWLMAAGPALGPRLATLRRGLARPPLTVLHGDLRLDNLLLRPDGPPVFLDWQTVVRGRGGFDLAYLVAGNLRHHDAAAIDTLVTAYSTALGEAGWEAYDESAVRDDVRHGVAFLWGRTVTAGARLGFAGGDRRARFEAALARWCAAAEALGVRRILGA